MASEDADSSKGARIHQCIVAWCPGGRESLNVPMDAKSRRSILGKPPFNYHKADILAVSSLPLSVCSDHLSNSEKFTMHVSSNDPVLTDIIAEACKALRGENHDKKRLPQPGYLLREKLTLQLFVDKFNTSARRNFVRAPDPEPPTEPSPQQDARNVRALKQKRWKPAMI